MNAQSFMSLETILKKAIQFEEISAVFYKNLQSKTEKKSNLTLLEMLENQEWDHKKTIEELLKKENLENITVQFPPDFSFTFPQLEKDDPSFEEIINCAIQREIISAELYDNAAAATTGYIKDVLSGLAQFERVHERSLKELKYQ